LRFRRFIGCLVALILGLSLAPSAQAAKSPAEVVGFDAPPLGSPSSGSHPVSIEPVNGHNGYWILDASGAVTAFGEAPLLGSAPVDPVPAVAMASTGTGLGYWILRSDGSIAAFGDASMLGSAPSGSSYTDIEVAQGGYLVLSDRGAVIPFGQARFFGDTANFVIRGRAVSLAVFGGTDGSAGYWFLTDAGGVFTFGAASFYGSIGNLPISAVAIEPTPTYHGYWIAGGDGRIAAFGDASWHGAFVGLAVVGIAPAPDGRGYWALAGQPVAPAIDYTAPDMSGTVTRSPDTGNVLSLPYARRWDFSLGCTDPPTDGAVPSGCSTTNAATADADLVFRPAPDSVTFDEEGTHYLRTHAVDRAGNYQNEETGWFAVDLTPPHGTVTSQRSAAMAHRNVTFEATAGDPKLVDGTQPSGVTNVCFAVTRLRGRSREELGCRLASRISGDEYQGTWSFTGRLDAGRYEVAARISDFTQNSSVSPPVPYLVLPALPAT
jgi:hypothetical protein